MPGLVPELVEELVDRVGERFRVGFVQDDEGRRWVVRVPADAVAAAQLEESASLAGLLSGRLPFEVPEITGAAALPDGRRAVVYPLISGRCVDFGALPPGPGLTVSISTAIAAVHNIDRRLFEEADVPAYEADDLRRRRQADVDRGAATGLVPTGLLARWERMLDDVSWWRFAPTPVHGRLQDDHVLLRFDDPQDADAGRVVGVTSWENAQIADPAQDLAALLALCPAPTVETVLEAYAAARREPPDAHLADRASLLAELEYLSELLTARRLGDRRHLTQATEALRRLDDVVSHGHSSGNRSGTAVDRLPVDFEPGSSGGELYQSGGPTRRIGETAEVGHERVEDSKASEGSEASVRAGRAVPTPRPDSAPEPEHVEGPDARREGGDTAPMPVVVPDSAPILTAPQEPVPTPADPASPVDPSVERAGTRTADNGVGDGPAGGGRALRDTESGEHSPRDDAGNRHAPEPRQGSDSPDDADGLDDPPARPRGPVDGPHRDRNLGGDSGGPGGPSGPGGPLSADERAARRQSPGNTGQFSQSSQSAEAGADDEPRS